MLEKEVNKLLQYLESEEEQVILLAAEELTVLVSDIVDELPKERIAQLAKAITIAKTKAQEKQLDVLEEIDMILYEIVSFLMIKYPDLGTREEIQEKLTQGNF